MSEASKILPIKTHLENTESGLPENATQTQVRDWDIDVTAHSAPLNMNVKELWQYRDLLILLVKRDFVAKYKQTVLGPMWHLLQPLLSTLMSYLLFNVVAHISTEGKNEVLFQLSGITIWSYFSTCLTGTSSTFITNASLFGKVYFPRLIMPISVVISNLLQMVFQFGLLFFAIVYFVFFRQEPVAISYQLLLIPVVVVLLAILGLGLGIIISSLTTKYRDLIVLIGFGVQLLMFGSAVNYPLSALTAASGGHYALYLLVKWNPVSTLVETFRNAILGGNIQWDMLGYTTVFSIIILFCGVLFFQKVERTFMDTV